MIEVAADAPAQFGFAPSAAQVLQQESLATPLPDSEDEFGVEVRIPDTSSEEEEFIPNSPNSLHVFDTRVGKRKSNPLRERTFVKARRILQSN